MKNKTLVLVLALSVGVFISFCMSAAAYNRRFVPSQIMSNGRRVADIPPGQVLVGRDYTITPSNSIVVLKYELKEESK